MPKIVDKNKKAAAIAQAALGAFCERGYHRTRMADVARAAGVGKGTLYEYFDDKAAILRASFDQYFDAFLQGAQQATQNVERPSERLTALIAFALRHVRDWEEHCTVYVDYFGVARTEEGGAFSLDALYEAFGSMLRSLIEEGQAAGEIRPELDAAASAQLLLSLYDGMVLHAILQQRLEHAAQTTTGLSDVALAIVERGMFLPVHKEECSCSATSS